MGRLRVESPVSGDVLGEEMVSAEEGVLIVGGSGSGLDALVPGFEYSATHPALHLDAEVPVCAEASLS